MATLQTLAIPRAGLLPSPLPDGCVRLSSEALEGLGTSSGKPVLLSTLHPEPRDGVPRAELPARVRHWLGPALGLERGLLVRGREGRFTEVGEIDPGTELPDPVARALVPESPAFSKSASLAFPQLQEPGAEPGAAPALAHALSASRTVVADALEIVLELLVSPSPALEPPSTKALERVLQQRYLCAGALLRLPRAAAVGAPLLLESCDPGYAFPEPLPDLELLPLSSESSQHFVYHVRRVVGNRGADGKALLARVSGLSRVRVLSCGENIEPEPLQHHWSASSQPSLLLSKPLASIHSPSGAPLAPRERGHGAGNQNPEHLERLELPERVDLRHPGVREVLDLVQLNRPGWRAQFARLGLRPPQGLLLHGGSGTGKSWAVRRALELLWRAENQAENLGNLGNLEEPGGSGKGEEDWAGALAGAGRVRLIEVPALEILVGAGPEHRALPPWKVAFPARSADAPGPSGSSSEGSGLPEGVVAAGDAEERLRKLFREARALAESQGCTVCVLLDGVELLCPKRGRAASASEARLVATLLTELDGVRPRSSSSSSHVNGGGGAVVVVGATAFPDALDPALRRPGRLDRELRLAGPPEHARRDLLLKLCHEALARSGGKLRLAQGISFSALARSSVGYLPSDLELLVSLAARHALKIISSNKQEEEEREQMKPEDREGFGEKQPEHEQNFPVVSLNADHFARALDELVAGSYRRENMGWLKEESVLSPQTPYSSESPASESPASESPDSEASLSSETQTDEALESLSESLPGEQSRLSDAERALLDGSGELGGMDRVQQRLLRAVVWPALFPERFLRLGVSPPRGILLYGPPGCGKTSVVRAMARALARISASSTRADERKESLVEEMKSLSLSEREPGLEHLENPDEDVGGQGPPRCSFFTLAGGAALFSAQVGESERRLRELFQLARANLPAVLFLDEIDCLAGNRGSLVPAKPNDKGDAGDSSGDAKEDSEDDQEEFSSPDFSASSGGSGAAPTSVEARILSTLLNEMDGLQRFRLADSAWGHFQQQHQQERQEGEKNEGPSEELLELGGRLLMVASTNRPDSLDGALLRPGRFDECIYVPPPDERGRLEILRIHCRRAPLAPDADLALLARRTRLFSGADLQNLCREAVLERLRRALRADPALFRNPASELRFPVEMRDFEAALRSVGPSLNPAMLRRYERMARHGFHG